MSTYTDYTAYFKQLAVDLIGETDTEKHFFRKGLDEFLNGMSTSVNYPALLLDKYDFKYTDNGGDNIMKVRTIAFIICDHASDIEDYDRLDEITDLTEGLIDRIYNRIRQDAEEPRNEFLNDVDLGQLQATPVQNYGDGNFGFFVSIPIGTIHNTSIL